MLAFPAPAVALQAKTTKDAAEIGKLEAEKVKLERDNGWPNRLIPLGATFVAALGLFIGVRKAGKDRRDALKVAAEERRQSDEGRFDTRFDAAVTRLTSDSPLEQRAGAVLLSTLVRDRDRTNAAQAVALVVALLKDGGRRDREAVRLLGITLSELVRDTSVALDLRDLVVARLNLNGAELKGVDLAYSRITDSTFNGTGLEHSKAIDAHLRDVEMRDCRLGRSEWKDVEIVRADAHRSNVVSAKLTRCTLRKVRLHRANLKKASFDGSKFTEVDLSRTNLEGASFRRVQFDQATLDTVVTSNWEAADFDPHIKERLTQLAAKKKSAEPSR